MKAKNAFLLATLLMILIPIIYKISIYNATLDFFWWDVIFRKTILCRLDSIGYGLFSAWIYYYYPIFWQKIKIPTSLIGISLIIFIINFEQDTTTIYKQIIYFSLTPFSVMFFLPIAESYKKATGILPSMIEYISKISYSMYLINLALVAEVIRDNFAPQGGIDSILKYSIYWIIVILASSLLYKYFEKPIMDLRDKEFKIPFLSKK